jgi:hypothetical protein
LDPQGVRTYRSVKRRTYVLGGGRPVTPVGADRPLQVSACEAYSAGRARYDGARGCANHCFGGCGKRDREAAISSRISRIRFLQVSHLPWLQCRTLHPNSHCEREGGTAAIKGPMLLSHLNIFAILSPCFLHRFAHPIVRHRAWGSSSLEELAGYCCVASTLSFRGLTVWLVARRLRLSTIMVLVRRAPTLRCCT